VTALERGGSGSPPLGSAMNRQYALKRGTLDTITFNRDYDLSDVGTAAKWTFDGSYSSFAKDRLKQPKSTGIAVNLIDTMLSDRATMTQIPMNVANRKDRIQIAHRPELRAFVTDKITNLPVTPAYEQKLTRHKEHTLVHNHEGILGVNIQTALPQKPPRTLTPIEGAPRLPLFRPMGSVQPMNTHPGRHRYFIADVRTKLI